MNCNPYYHGYLSGRCGIFKCPECGKRLEGVQGPEQGLVGESLRDSETRPAEEAKPGERGVGEIVELAELQRHIECKYEEELGALRRVRCGKIEIRKSYLYGKMQALDELLQVIERITEKRSDLSNSQLCQPASQDNHTKP